jgi:hypothetical protein
MREVVQAVKTRQQISGLSCKDCETFGFARRAWARVTGGFLFLQSAGSDAQRGARFASDQKKDRRASCPFPYPAIARGESRVRPAMAGAQG